MISWWACRLARMLPKSRIVSALLVGLGLALIVAGLVAPRFLNGDARFPLNLENTTWTLHDPEGVVGEEDGAVTVPVTHQLHMTVQNPASEHVVALRVGDSLLRADKETDLDNLVAASTWSLEIDRMSGQFEGPARLSSMMAFPETEVPVDGVWLKFPSNLEPEAYQVFDPVLRETAPATFTGEQQQYGRTVYTFEQKVPATNLAAKFNDGQNTMTIQGEDGGMVKAFRHHAATRTFTVDQITGLVIGMTEKVDDYYADRSGARVKEIVSYDAAMDEEQTRQLAEQLPKVTQRISQGVTYGVIGLGTLLTLAGLLGAFRPGGKRSRDH